MKVDASSAGDMPAFAGLRRSMGALGHVFCTFLRPLPRIRWGWASEWTWESRLAFPHRTGILKRGIARKINTFRVAHFAQEYVPAVRKIKWLRK